MSLWRSVKALEEGEKPGLSRTGCDLVAESVTRQMGWKRVEEGVGGRVGVSFSSQSDGMKAVDAVGVW